jgi:hypothetical protein
MDDCLAAEDVGAFGIQLEGQVAKVNFENGQVVNRSLGHDLQPGLFMTSVPKWALFAAKDGFEPFEIQPRPGSVNQGFNQLFQL